MATRGHLAWAPDCCDKPAHSTPLAALGNSAANQVCRVVCADPPVGGRCTPKSALWCYDATPVYRAFAREEALRVAHLWDAPPIVLQYLRTGDESIRVAAEAAAWDAARATAWDAAWGTAWGAARDAAGAAARAAACAAAGEAAWATWDAVRATAWDAAWVGSWTAARAAAWAAAGDADRAAGDADRAAWDAARATAWDADRATAWDATRAAARDAAWDAARDTTRRRQNRRLAKLLTNGRRLYGQRAVP